MSTDRIKYPVIICRGISNYRCAEYDADKISNVHWDNISGGVNRRQAGYSLYGYIPYEDAAELIDCSGRHNYGYNDAKVCIRASDNKSERYQDGYKLLVNQAGTKPSSSTRPSGAQPCTKRILSLLDEVGEITRSELREKLMDEGYNDTTIRNAIKRLENQWKIKMDGPSQSPRQKISKQLKLVSSEQ